MKALNFCRLKPGDFFLARGRRTVYMKIKSIAGRGFGKGDLLHCNAVNSNGQTASFMGRIPVTRRKGF
jgi:hypothetical protein